MSEKWDRRFLELAHHIAGWSKDPSTQVGCVVVGPDREIRSTGFNGFPRGIDDSPKRLTDRALKYPFICHAEENAIMHAARIGVSLKDCSAYVTWPPCTRCARSLIQAGVHTVLYPADLEIPERWREDFDMSNEMFSEAQVTIRTVNMDRE
ncbi:MAG: dCMP deaminase family protein [Myxococcota bacterium]